MNNGKLLTVIIPNYNKEKYLEQCIQSVINQTYRPIEIIIVDDCSSDSSKEIIETFEKKYPYIKSIFQKKNGGVSLARNKKLLKKVYLYLMLITAPATVFFFFYAEETVLLLAGESYRAAIVPMQIITITVFIVTFSCLFGGRVLVSLNKAGTQLNSVICGTVVNCVSNAILIPKFGVSGAATATVLSEFTVLLYCLVKVPKEYRISFEMKDVAKIIIATFMAISVASLTKNVCENVFLKFIYGAGSFGIIYLILLVILREEVVINLIKKCKEKGIREIFKEF